MATKELKQIWNNVADVAVVVATIAVAILEQRQRKFSPGYLQNRDLQFPNLTYARPRLPFTLIFNYKRNTHHMEERPRINIEKIKRKIRKKQNSRENKSAPLTKSAELFRFNFHHSLVVPLLTL